MFWVINIISNQVYDGIWENCDLRKKKQIKNCSWIVVKFLKVYFNIDIFNIYTSLWLNDTEIPNSSKHVALLSDQVKITCFLEIGFSVSLRHNGA